MTKKIIDYSKTIIYKIVSNDLNIIETYVGSTTNFTKRKTHHKSNCNNINGKWYNLKVYEFIRSNGGWDQFTMVEIEKCNCSDGNEARAIERRWYEQLNAKLNMVCPGAYVNGIKEYQKNYRQENSEKLKIYEENRKEQKKIYYEQNKEKINEQRKVPFLCECGCTIRKQEKLRHQKTKKHIKLILQLNNPNDD